MASVTSDDFQAVSCLICTVCLRLLKTSPKLICALAVLGIGPFCFADGKEVNPTVQQIFTCVACEDVGCIDQMEEIWCKDPEEKIWSKKTGMLYCDDGIQTDVPCHQGGRVYLRINEDGHSGCRKFDMEGKNVYINSFETECPQSKKLPPANPPPSDPQAGITNPSSGKQAGITNKASIIVVCGGVILFIFLV